MSVKRLLLAIFACGGLFCCGGGGNPAPEPVAHEEPLPDPQEPRSNSQDPTLDPQAPLIGVQEPLPNGQDPALQIGGEGGASPGQP